MSLRGEAVVPMNRDFTSFAMTICVNSLGFPAMTEICGSQIAQIEFVPTMR